MTHARRIASALLLSASALVFGACASKTASPERPTAAAPPRFAMLTASDERRAAALVNWRAVVGEQAAQASPTPELLPVTATLASLPAGLTDLPRLPLVVIDKDAQAHSEEEMRESLRRFLATAAPLLGVNLKHLALVGVSDAPQSGAGARRALYRQTPFAYPLRNGYGDVAVTFTPDLRVVALSSTALPDAEAAARTLAAVPKTLTAEQAVAALANGSVTYTDRFGARQTRVLTPADAPTARELVVFPFRTDSGDAGVPSLELHVAWEVAVGGSQTPLLIYVDAGAGVVLGARQEATGDGGR